MRRSVKRALGAGIVGGVAFAAWRAWNARAPHNERGVEWTTAPFPFPPVPRPGAPAPAAPAEPAAPSPSAWTEPNPDGTCPPTHPVKAKLTSGIYHVPGTGNYERTKPDRCYVNAEAANADGLRPAKR